MSEPNGRGAAYPQFMHGGRGARIWDVDGNEYVDLMCSYGPVVLGHQHPAVEAAAAAQAALGDCQNGPGPVMVDLAELLVQTVRHADWAMFAKNGTDATAVVLRRPDVAAQEGHRRREANRKPRRRTLDPATVAAEAIPANGSRLCSGRGVEHRWLWPPPMPPSPCGGALSRQPRRVY